MGKLDIYRVGDLVDIDDGVIGTVVFNAAIDEWSLKYPKEEWGYLSGIMIEQLNGALVFHPTEYFEAEHCRIKHAVVEKVVRP